MRPQRGKHLRPAPRPVTVWYGDGGRTEMGEVIPIPGPTTPLRTLVSLHQIWEVAQSAPLVFWMAQGPESS